MGLKRRTAQNIVWGGACWMHARFYWMGSDNQFVVMVCRSIFLSNFLLDSATFLGVSN